MPAVREPEQHAESGEAFVTIDEGGLILDIHGYGPAERFIAGVEEGTALSANIHADDREFFDLTRFWILSGTGKACTVTLRWARDGGRWSNVHATFTAASSETVRVTLRADGEAYAKRAEAQMRRVVEGSLQGIVVRTSKEALYTNDGFAHLLGYTSARQMSVERASLGIDSGLHPDDAAMIAERIRRRVAGDEQISHYEYRILDRSGEYRWVETRATRIDWDGQAASLSWIGDISDRKRMEQELVASKEAAEFANRTKTEFLANMSHELRTPLNAILGFSEVIKDQLFGPVAGRYADYARDIHRSGAHLLEIINDILDLSKLEAGKLDLHESDVAIGAVAEDCLTLLSNKAAEMHVTLVNAMPSNLPLLRADARAVKQVMLNFLSNAVKFTPEGGKVTIAAKADSKGLCISVTDTGIGMTPEQIAVALSAFGQVDSKLARKHEGTGLGLPICRSLLELHGGSLDVTSVPDVGTTMTATFPARRFVAVAA